ncbi:MAG: HlyD family type I secretion periplasmic adaptor subunit [Leptolyngbyaceae cyanobacterium]
MKPSSSETAASSTQLVKHQFSEPESDLSYRVVRAARQAPPWYAKFLLGSISLTVISGVIWASMWEFPVITVARGQITTSDELRPIKSLNSGTILEVNISEGENVDEGEDLIKQDVVLSETEIENLERSRELISTDINRLQNELSGNRGALGGLQDRLLAARLDGFRSRLDAAQAEINKQEAIISTANIELSNLEVALENAKNKEQVLGKLNTEGAFPELSYIDARDNVTSLEGQVAAQQEKIRQVDQDYQAALQEQELISSERDGEILSLINELEKERALIESQLSLVQTEIDSTQFIKAPISGQVYNIKVTPGPVQAGEELFSILPEGEEQEYLMEAKLSNKDRGFVSDGMEVRVKLSAFPPQDYGSIQGRVVVISPDAVQDEALGQVFPVTIELEQNSIDEFLERIRDDGLERTITSGLEATAEIITPQQRTVLDFLLDPIVSSLEEAFSVQ